MPKAIESIWGEEFNVAETETKSLIKKASSPSKKVESPETLLKSKKVDIKDKIALVESRVDQILGVYKENTQVIRTMDDLSAYIDKAIDNGVIAVDTETDNSLDPITCLLMGLCIYTPGQKNAYVPVHHTTLDGILLENQLTEKDIREQLERLSNTKIITHNGSFDYQVIKCTTGYVMNIYWDTMIGARLLNENERAGLKLQYISKIDPSIEKYSITSLFENIPYAYQKPEIFACYAATDAYMTYRLYEYQRELFDRPENARLKNLFFSVEIPIVTIAAEMELTGVCIDKEYASKLAQHYRKRLSTLNAQISEELKKLEPKIAEWRCTPEAVFKPARKRGEGLGRSKSEQLESPVNITSPTQLAILMYDVLKLPSTDKKTPRGTGEDILKKLGDKFPLGKIILEERGLLKLLNTFVEAIPASVNERDGRLHAHFNTLGTDTGRFSSSEPNLYNWRLKLVIA